MVFTVEQLNMLEEEIDPSRISTRRKQGIELRYIEGHDVISRANQIFGYGAWSYRITKLAHEQSVWVATIELTVLCEDGESVSREDVGVGIPAISRDDTLAGVLPSPDAHETAIKGAVTDALKRAFRTFGNAFGNSLYEKVAPAATQSGQTTTVAETGDGEQPRCRGCGGATVLRSGTTRDGRPYSAWFCVAKCGEKPIFLADRKQPVA